MSFCGCGSRPTPAGPAFKDDLLPPGAPPEEDYDDGFFDEGPPPQLEGELEEEQEWIITADFVTVYMGPADGFAVIGECERGTEVVATQSNGDWLAIRWKRQETGWIRTENEELVFAERIRGDDEDDEDGASGDAPPPPSEDPSEDGDEEEEDDEDLDQGDEQDVGDKKVMSAVERAREFKRLQKLKLKQEDAEREEMEAAKPTTSPAMSTRSEQQQQQPPQQQQRTQGYPGGAPGMHPQPTSSYGGPLRPTSSYMIQPTTSYGQANPYSAYSRAWFVPPSVPQPSPTISRARELLSRTASVTTGNRSASTAPRAAPTYSRGGAYEPRGGSTSYAPPHDARGGGYAPPPASARAEHYSAGSSTAPMPHGGAHSYAHSGSVRPELLSRSGSAVRQGPTDPESIYMSRARALLTTSARHRNEPLAYEHSAVGGVADGRPRFEGAHMQAQRGPAGGGSVAGDDGPASLAEPMKRTVSRGEQFQQAFDDSGRQRRATAFV